MLATCWYVADLELITVPFIIESMLHFTSFAVTGRPSWKRTPCRRWKIYVSGLGISQLWATHGCRTKCSSLRTRESNNSSSMRSEKASVPMRGSRFAGLLSINITIVFGSGCDRVQPIEVNVEIPTRQISLRIGARALMVWGRSLSDITDLAENRGISRAGRRRNVPGFVMPCLICEQRESNSFLGLTRHAKIIRCAYPEPERLNLIGDHAH